jgi:hypothetical protein
MAMPYVEGHREGFDIVAGEEALSRNRTETKAITRGGKSDSNLDGLTSRPVNQV